jgi:WXG100 family type VII secretion target
MPFDSSSYSVHTNSMLESNEELRAITNKIRQTLEDLESSMVSFNYTAAGLAPDAFNEAKAKWDQGAGEMQAALDKGTSSLQQIHDDYVNADAQSARSFYGS